MTLLLELVLAMGILILVALAAMRIWLSNCGRRGYGLAGVCYGLSGWFGALALTLVVHRRHRTEARAWVEERAREGGLVERAEVVMMPARKGWVA